MKKLLSAAMGLTGTAFFAGQALAQEIPNPAEGWDHLWFEILVDITIFGVILMVAAVVFIIKYKASSPEQVGTAKPMSTANAIGWVLIPAAIFMADDFFLAASGWTLWNTYRRVPEDAMEIQVTAYQWYFEFEYPDGQVSDTSCSDENGDNLFDIMSECAEGLVLPVGQPVVFRMTSEDVIHDFGLPQFRVKEDVMPGRQTYIWINPVEVGEWRIQCAEFCGNDHSRMMGRLRVVSQDDFDAWLIKMDEG
jgi:cytochrome c oxidase subunit 2